MTSTAVHSLLDLNKSTQTGVITHVDASEQTASELTDFGFIPGTSVSFFSKTPFSGPVAYYLRDSKVVIRRADASKIKIRLVDAPHLV